MVSTYTQERTQLRSVGHRWPVFRFRGVEYKDLDVAKLACARCGRTLRGVRERHARELDTYILACSNGHRIETEDDVMLRSEWEAARDRAQRRAEIFKELSSEWLDEEVVDQMPMTDIKTGGNGMMRIGVIRLGEKRISQKSGNEYPVDVPYFVLKDAPDVLAAFVRTHYPGERPPFVVTKLEEVTSLPVYLPFPRPEEVLDQWHKLWGSGYIKCQGDGETIDRLLNGRGQVVVRDGVVKLPFTDRETTGREVAWEPGMTGVPCPGYDHDLYPRCAKCKGQSTLKVIVRDPERPSIPLGARAGYYQIRTHSSRAAADLYEQLQTIVGIAARLHKGIVGIPCVLHRTEAQMSFYDERAGQRKTSTHWPMGIEPDPTWMEFAMAQLHDRALTAGAEPAPMLLTGGESAYTPEDRLSDDETDGYDHSWKEGEDAPLPGQPEPQFLTGKQIALVRERAAEKWGLTGDDIDEALGRPLAEYDLSSGPVSDALEAYVERQSQAEDEPDDDAVEGVFEELPDFDEETGEVAEEESTAEPSELDEAPGRGKGAAPADTTDWGRRGGLLRKLTQQGVDSPVGVLAHLESKGRISASMKDGEIVAVVIGAPPESEPAESTQVTQPELI